MRYLLALAVISLACGPAFGQVANGPVITGTNLTVSTLTTGTLLDVTPTISADGRYVTMGMHPTFSTLEGFQTFDSTGRSIAGGGAGRAVGIVQIPFRPAQVGKVIFVENDKKLLTGEIPAMTLPQTSLKDAVGKLADASKTNVVLGIRGLEEAGVDLAAAHTFTIEKGTIKEALLALVKVAAPQKDLVINADDGVIELVSQAQADNNVITRTYYLEDLLANLPRIVSSKTDLYTLKPADKEAGKAEAIPSGPAGVLPPAVAVVPKPQDGAAGPMRSAAEAGNLQAVGAEKPAENYSTDIAQVIMSAVRPEIWKARGGKIGEIAVVGDRVTIRAPASVQALLDGPKHYNPNAVPMYVGYGTR